MVRRFLGLVLSLSLLSVLATPAFAEGKRLRHSVHHMRLMAKALAARNHAQTKQPAATQSGVTKASPAPVAARPKVPAVVGRKMIPVRR